MTVAVTSVITLTFANGNTVWGGTYITLAFSSTFAFFTRDVILSVGALLSVCQERTKKVSPSLTMPMERLLGVSLWAWGRGSEVLKNMSFFISFYRQQFSRNKVSLLAPWLAQNHHGRSIRRWRRAFKLGSLCKWYVRSQSLISSKDSFYRITCKQI
jgi:hypothetical protein